MPTTQQWISEQILMTKWSSRLTSSEVSTCFAELTDAMQNSDQVVHIVFDIRDAGSIPSQAPMHFIRSEIAQQRNLGGMAVVGTESFAQILAQIAIKMTGQNILFFPDEQQALDYLQSC